MKGLWILALGAFVTLTHCSGNEEDTQQYNGADLSASDTAAMQVASPVLYAYTYGCANDVTFEVHIDPANRAAILTLDSHEYSLQQDTTASGTRYSNDTIAFWSKGDSAFVIVHDSIWYRNCVIIPRSAIPFDTL